MNKLIIIGASNLQLPLILKAKEMGLETHVFAWEEGAVGRVHSDFFYPISIIEKEEILKEAVKIKPSGIISIASDLATITVNYIANKLNLIGNSLECNKVTTDKYLMRERLSSNNIRCPKFTKSENINEIQRIFNYKFPLIVKPTDRSGSRGVTKVNNVTELSEAIERAKDNSFNKKIIVEEFIEGSEISVEMISWAGAHSFLQITDKETTGSPYFVETGQHQPSKFTGEIKNVIISTVSNSLNALKVLFGASHSELLITKNNEIYIVEIGARMGGDFIGSHLVELSTGFDFVKAVIDVSLGRKPQINLKNQYFSGVYYICPKVGKVEKIIDKTSNYPEIVFKEIYIKGGAFTKEIKESNDRAACYIYKSKEKKFLNSDNIIKYFVN